MARLFALGDLHLSGIGAKPMHVFDEIWRDHDRTMASAWDALVGADDTVLLAGDLSWGRNLDEARPDLEWIGVRPGRKLLVKGNHDGWWGSPRKVREHLPEGCSILQNDAHEAEGWVVVGARGWLAPGDPFATASDERVFQRELERLRLSIRDADRRFGTDAPRLAVLHFPPWLEGRDPSPVVELLARAGVRVVVYGHLHGSDHALAVRGERGGMTFVFVAADAVDFTPVPLPAPAP